MTPSEGVERWRHALAMAWVFALAPEAIGGIVVRSRPGPVRDEWLHRLRRWLPSKAPWLRMPCHVTEDRLLGGMDLAATLESRRLVTERGMLELVDGGVLLAPMAERLEPMVAAHLASALDRREVAVERDGVARRFSTRFAVVALDEGVDDERVDPKLRDRLPLHLDLEGLSVRDLDAVDMPAELEPGARDLFERAEAEPKIVEGLCGVALGLGIPGLRPVMASLNTARAVAALRGRDRVEEQDVALAAAWVLFPRATQLPSAEPAEEPPPPEPPPPEGESQDDAEQPMPDRPMADRILEAAVAMLPPGILAALATQAAARTRMGALGPAGQLMRSQTRGRRAGTRRGEMRPGARLSLIETLRAAAPWQGLRRPEGSTRVHVKLDDLRLHRFRHRSETVTIFAVDASGSSALQRLAEAKGAVEHVLGECYVRRDQVALIAFRGDRAELVLPPTRSLIRAKRSLAQLPGGGTTPLAAGIDAARVLAEDARRRGQTPVLVLMTDGRANVARDGTPGRAGAESDALASAKLVRVQGVPALFVDTGPRPQERSRRVAEAMGAHYLGLPYTDTAGLSRTVQALGSGSD